jgi:uncharacterized SAM-binding protein YcdF (DUF218 family)
MFFIKKIVSRFLFPMPLSLELLLVGLILLWFTRRQRAGKALVTMGTVVLLGFSNLLTSNALLRPLEHQYRPIPVAPTGPPSAPAVSYIVVLGGFADHDPDVPITSHISPDLLVRLIEGVRLHREVPGTKLILSGNHDSAEGMTQVAESLGVGAQDILSLAQPRDTEEESQQIAPIVGDQRFILVTSASHMPRAMGLFRKRGLQPVAAPTDYLTPSHQVEPDDYFPDGFKLYKAQVAIYEYLGMAWETLRNKM